MYVVSLLVIPWMIYLSELSYVMKNGYIIATLTPRNCGSVPAILPKSSFKKSVRPQRNVVCLMEFWRCESLGVFPNGRAVYADLYSEQLERIHEILKRIYPALVNRNGVLLQQDNARPHTAQQP